jgi:uncharacterized membrane protein
MKRILIKKRNLDIINQNSNENNIIKVSIIKYLKQSKTSNKRKLEQLNKQQNKKQKFKEALKEPNKYEDIFKLKDKNEWI